MPTETLNHFKITVICVTLNAAFNLPTLIESVKRFKKNELVEFIVVDGGSGDDTLQIIKQNLSVINFWISEPDNGIYHAMNKALKYARGDWVIFLGADDELAEGFETAIDNIRDSNAIYYGNVIYYNKVLDKRYDDYYLTKLNFCHQAMFYPKAVFEKYEYDIKYKVYADYYLNLQCWKDPDIKFIHLNNLVAKFSFGGFSSMHKDELFVSERDQLFKKFLKPSSYYRYLNRTQGFWTMLRLLLINR